MKRKLLVLLCACFLFSAPSRGIALEGQVSAGDHHAEQEKNAAATPENAATAAATSGPDIQLLEWSVNSMQTTLQLFADIINEPGDKSAVAFLELSRAAIAEQLGQSPCTARIMVRNQGSAGGSIDFAAFRLSIGGQTFRPTAAAIKNALRLKPIWLRAGQQAAGILVFMAPTELAKKANSGSAETRLRYDEGSAIRLSHDDSRIPVPEKWRQHESQMQPIPKPEDGINLSKKNLRPDGDVDLSKPSSDFSGGIRPLEKWRQQKEASDKLEAEPTPTPSDG